MFIVNYLETLPWAFGVITMVLIFVIFTIIGVLLVRKLVGVKSLKAHHDVAGFVFANLGVLYAVLLGFTVVNVQQRFDKIQGIAQVEASYLAALYQDAEVFPEKDRQAIRQFIKEYAENVISEEWEIMPKGVPSEKTILSLQNIWKSYYPIDPASNRVQAWYSESINKLNLLMNARLSRLMESQSSLGSEMWSLLIAGGIVIVTFIWFFGLESLTSHLLMASILAATTAFLLFLIYSLDTAFSGSVSVDPEAMERVLSTFDRA